MKRGPKRLRHSHGNLVDPEKEGRGVGGWGVKKEGGKRNEREDVGGAL